MAEGRRKPDGPRAALVTGGGTGIGRAIALALAADGLQVFVVGRRRAPLRETARLVGRAGGLAGFVPADVATPEGARAAVEGCVGAFGRLDVLVNNAGACIEGTIESLSVAGWRRTLAVNLDAVFLVSRSAMRHLRRRGGVIVNVTSTLGFRGLARSAAYCAAKAGAENLTRAMAIDHAPDRVRVVAVAPGIVATDMGLRGERRRSAAIRRQLDALHPWGRIGRPEDVAALVAALCRPESGWITGSVHVVDGGLTARG